MKFRIMFETPCAFFGSISVEMSDQEQKVAKELAEKFIENDEYIVIEFDTETQTARVEPLEERF